MKTMSETRLTEGPLHHLDGKLAECGWATSLLRAYDRDRIKAPKRRIKEWDYYLVNDDEFAVALTVADMGYVGLISASVMDFAQATSHTASVISPFPMGRFKLPATSAEGVTSFENNRVSFRFEVAGGQRRLNVWFAGFDGGDDLTFEAVLDEDAVLVSVQAANSEVGSIQPIAALARAAHGAGALFHTDAVQALGKAPVDVGAWGVDAASFSAHKVGGPKGVGALYLRARTPFEPQAIGGGQESGRRSGTQNVAGAAGFAAAVHAACGLQERAAARLSALRDRLYAGLAAHDAVEATVDVAPGSVEFLPNIVHVLVRGLESETLILRFDLRGFGVSGGSACSSHSLAPSHVLHALGIDDDRAHGALRISMGRYTTERDVDAFLGAVAGVLDWS